VSRHRVLAGFAALALGACASVDVEVARDGTARLPRLRAFAFPPGTAPALRDALERELAGRGLRLDRKSPDLLVSGAIAEEETTVFHPPRPASDRSPDGRFTLRQVRKTVLTVTVAEAASGGIVWVGRGVILLPDADTAEAVRAVIAEFPPAR
jgi:hypothetical protein